jgi:Tol biopolymer transport system component
MKSWRLGRLGPAVVWALFFSLTGAILEARTARSGDAHQLSGELAGQGWIVYTARTPRGDLDLFRARPDGSRLKNLTETPELDEFGSRFSPDGQQLLWRQTRRGQEINHDNWGAVGALVVADNQGRDRVLVAAAGELPWASWGPDGKRIACLYRSEGSIRMVDVKSGIQEGADLPAHGVFQQLFWSPDGKFLVGTANVAGREWNILVYDIARGHTEIISRSLNCTPDWFPDSSACLYSHRNPNIGSDDRGQRSTAMGENPAYSWTMLMRADREGRERNLLVAEQYRHLYFGCLSPDGKYLIYTRLETDDELLGPLAVVRTADTPIIDGEWQLLARRYRNSGSGPVLRLELPPGFEPHWTYAELP